MYLTITNRKKSLTQKPVFLITIANKASVLQSKCTSSSRVRVSSTRLKSAPKSMSLEAKKQQQAKELLKQLLLAFQS